MDAQINPVSVPIYALFPVVIGVDIDLSPNNWRWIHCLDIPIDLLNDHYFALKPHKWLRFAIGIVVGAEGELSVNSNQLELVDYDADILVDATPLFYHITDAEKTRMFPTDLDMAKSKVTSEVSTARRIEFRADVKKRDGESCVLTNVRALFSEAIHIIPYSKEDSYIEKFTRARSRDPSCGDHIAEIDDIRNGVFLNSWTHKVFGLKVAFLVTPNFAMNTSDVVPGAAENRCTAHLFSPGQNDLLGFGTHGCEIRVAPSDWPPAILFDGAYATAILENFRVAGFKEVVMKSWMEAFNPGGVTTAAQAQTKKEHDNRAAHNQKKIQEDQESDKRHKTRAGGGAYDEPDAFEILSQVPYLLVSAENRRLTLKDAERRAEASERKHAENKVNTWLQQVPGI